MIRCQDAAELIPLHVGDDLPAEEARRVEEHLDQCALCVAEYESYAAARDLIVDLRAEMPARGSLWAGVASGLDSAAGSAEAAAPRAPRFKNWMKWSSALAAALLAMVILPPLLKNPGVDPIEPASGDRMIQATTPEELQDILLRNGAMLSPASDPALQQAGSESPDAAGQDLPLTTPASNRPLRF